MPASLTIGELAARSGVPASTLRYYDRLGLIPAERSAGNQRRYPRSALRRVAFVRVAQRVGVSLDEITDALATLPADHTPTKADWQRLSRVWHERLDERIGLLIRLRNQLSGCIGCGCLSMKSCRLYNPDDELAAHGPGPRRVLEPDGSRSSERRAARRRPA
ncbi:MAG TPA: redox-sensitive transcriptional activator SoxR [Acidothermaceae bacterium]|nr:redox-sensitive transcriptional activator SoxR [Acidothermaceae bacterium]